MKSKEVLQVLKKSGWYEGRQLQTKYVIDIIKKEGYGVLDKVVDFLREYGDLVLFFLNKKNGISNDTIDFNFKKAMQLEFIERIEVYEERVGKKLCIVGTAYREHLILLMSEDGFVYGASDDFLCFFSNTGEGAIESIVMDFDVEVVK